MKKTLQKAKAKGRKLQGLCVYWHLYSETSPNIPERVEEALKEKGFSVNVERNPYSTHSEIYHPDGTKIGPESTYGKSPDHVRRDVKAACIEAFL